jgi:hypothetical protein
VYQFTSVPYGFKNSLSAFIRELEAMGDDVLNDNVITSWMACLFVHQASLITLTTRIRFFHKSTAAGFTINASKCNFCKPEIKFLGHITCDKTVKADPQRIVTILRYP